MWATTAWPRRDAAEHAAGVVGEEAIRRDFVAVLGALLPRGLHAVADFHALDGVEPHQRVGEVGVELVVQRLAPAGRHVLGHHADPGADRVARFAQRVHVVLELRHDGGAGREEGVVVDLVPRLEGNVDRAERAHVAADHDAVFFSQPLLGDGAGADDGRGQPCRRAPAAARVAEAVFLRVGVVGVAGAEGLDDVAVVLAALVLVADQERDRRAGRSCLHRGRIGFPPCRIRGAG